MENRDYNNDFENFLKTNADEFRMVPSARVWHSIYNNMHPDRKWPSIAACMLILLSVIYIGVSNNNSINNAALKTTNQNITSIIKDYNSDKNLLLLNATDFKIKKKQLQFSMILPLKEIKNTDVPFEASNTTNDYYSEADDYVLNNIPGVTSTNDDKIFLLDKIGVTSMISGAINIFSRQKMESALIENVQTELSPFISGQKKNSPINEATKTEAISDYDKGWREDYAFRNKPQINKLKQNGRISYYITPSFGYRGLSRNKDAQQRTSLLLANNSSTPSTNEILNDGMALNLEAGAAIQYKLNKKINLKTGLQVNYTNYVSTVTDIGHTTQTVLAVDARRDAVRSSTYSTKAGKTKLNRSTLQLALPVGADVKIAGNGKVDLYVGGSIQPTYLLDGNGYVLSADEKNYISETALLRKLNLNAALETFVTFEPSPGIKLSVGPQFRYQLLSTYKKEYNYSENLYNVGFKVGVSTKL